MCTLVLQGMWAGAWAGLYACVCTLQVLLNECVAPHVAELGLVSSATPSGPAAHICKMFR